MTDTERQARIGELLRVRILLADLLENVDQRLAALGYERKKAYEPPAVIATIEWRDGEYEPQTT